MRSGLCRITACAFLALALGVEQVDATLQKVSQMISGSSTVLPIASRWAVWFRGSDEPAVQDDSALLVDTENLGSSQGARRLCGGDIDIGTMSRDWHEHEASVVERASDDGPALFKCSGDSDIMVGQLPIAWDGIAVFIRSGGAADRCLTHVATPVTLEQVRWIFTGQGEGGTCKKWKDLPGNDGSDECEDACIQRWVPGNKSGTLAVFENTINVTFNISDGEVYNTSENDNQILQGVLNEGHAIGFVGYNYFQNASGLLSIVPLVSHIEQAFCMLTAEGKYPFARRLFMNINLDASPTAWDFLNFGLSDRGQHLVGDAGACRLSESSILQAKQYIASHWDPRSDPIDVEEVFEIFHLWVSGLLVAGCLFGLCLARIFSFERVRRRMPMCCRKTQALEPLIRSMDVGGKQRDIIIIPDAPVIGKPLVLDVDVEADRDPNFKLTSMLQVCGAEIGSFLSWSDVRQLWPSATQLSGKLDRQSSTSPGPLLDCLLEEVWSAMEADSPAGRALQYWFMQAPSLQWCLTLTGEGVAALLWSLGVLSMIGSEQVVGWHAELATLIMQRRAGCWTNQQLIREPNESLCKFVMGGRLPEIARYVQWAYGGNHMELRSADLIPVLMDLDPVATGHMPVPPTPAQALRCAQGLMGLVLIDGQYYCFPRNAWLRSGRSDLQPFSDLTAFEGPISEERSSPPPSILGDLADETRSLGSQSRSNASSHSGQLVRRNRRATSNYSSSRSGASRSVGAAPSLNGSECPIAE